MPPQLSVNRLIKAAPDGTRTVLAQDLLLPGGGSNVGFDTAAYSTNVRPAA